MGFRAFPRRRVLRRGIARRAVLLASLWPALAPAAQAARAYVSNEDDGTVTVLDTQRLRALATLPPLTVLHGVSPIRSASR